MSVGLFSSVSSFVSFLKVPHIGDIIGYLFFTDLLHLVWKIIHIAASGIISLFFYVWVISHCIYVPHLYPFICHRHLGGFHVFLVQLLSRVQLFATPWTAAHQASLSSIISQGLLKLMSIESLMPSNYLILCRPLLLLPSIFPSTGVFSNELSLCIRYPKYWTLSFSISSSSEYSELISFRIDWFDLLAVQGTLKSLLQPHSLKTSILWCSPFFMVQLSHPYMTTGKTIILTIQTFVSKVMSLLFNTLSRFVIAFPSMS